MVKFFPHLSQKTTARGRFCYDYRKKREKTPLIFAGFMAFSHTDETHKRGVTKAY